MHVQTAQFFKKKMAINFVKLTMPQVEGKANYKVDALIQVVEEKLPNGAQVWQEGCSPLPAP
jgi:hypothetical protein